MCACECMLYMSVCVCVHVWSYVHAYTCILTAFVCVSLCVGPVDLTCHSVGHGNGLWELMISTEAHLTLSCFSLQNSNCYHTNNEMVETTRVFRAFCEVFVCGQKCVLLSSLEKWMCLPACRYFSSQFNGTQCGSWSMFLSMKSFCTIASGDQL